MSQTEENKPKAIFLMGPTASGKTALAVELVKRFPVDIISVDSALVYKDMNIGTAKPDAETLKTAPHRLIDLCSPESAYSVSLFRDDAIREMEEITAAGRVPLLVGGTMLYYHALQRGLAQLPQADENIRIDLRARIEAKGLQALHDELRVLDPLMADRLHPNDTQRIMRAIEVHLITGETLSALHAKQKEYAAPYDFIKLIRSAERATLHERINQRFLDMLEQGFEKEVEGLLLNYVLDKDSISMRTVGYRQMLGYLEDEYDHQTMIEKGQAATRQLAKRQLTWLKKETQATWLEKPCVDETLDDAIDAIGDLF